MSVNVPKVLRINSLMCTKQEFDACIMIARCYKKYLFRKACGSNIQKKKIALFHQKQMKNLLKVSVAKIENVIDAGEAENDELYLMRTSRQDLGMNDR